MQNDLDKDLQALFKEKSQTLPEEPFLSNLILRVEKQRSRRVLKRRLILALGFACCVLLSPVLIRGSIVLSSGLNKSLGMAADLLATPAGMSAVALGVVLILIFKRRLIFSLM